MRRASSPCEWTSCSDTRSTLPAWLQTASQSLTRMSPSAAGERWSSSWLPGAADGRGLCCCCSSSPRYQLACGINLLFQRVTSLLLLSVPAHGGIMLTLLPSVGRDCCCCFPSQASIHGKCKCKFSIACTQDLIFTACHAVPQQGLLIAAADVCMAVCRLRSLLGWQHSSSGRHQGQACSPCRQKSHLQWSLQHCHRPLPRSLLCSRQASSILLLSAEPVVVYMYVPVVNHHVHCIVACSHCL